MLADLGLMYNLDACKAKGINPKITLIIVGKRHHIRYVVHGPFMEVSNSNILTLFIYLECSLRTKLTQTRVATVRLGPPLTRALDTLPNSITIS